ncbi:cell wall hydrolase [Aurantiacibacter marinus]|uniref:cell wall hydrolase n=1 Tax=Aurantiacibacter marinus TaxID=874156 RepID=UPI0009E3C5C4|nr:cell wall hydrolase [Aurantiacibacter marinus]
MPISIPENPRRDFRTPRVSLREKLRPLAKKAIVAGLAVAVPAIAANGAISAFESEPETPQTVLMPFEIPGESFPGSAFYYLEEVPQMVENKGWDSPVQVIGSAVSLDTASEGAETQLANLPLAASPLRIRGTDRDHMRAQECMTQAIYYEAASESDAGQRAVAQVVLNRVAHSAYPRNVCGVVYQGSERTTGCQFSFTCDGALSRRPSATGWARASRIARQSLAGIVYAPVGTATHYHTLAVNPYWASSLETVGVIGFHIFYRWPGSAGRPSAFNAGYAGAEPAARRASASTPDAPAPESPPAMPGFSVPATATNLGQDPVRQAPANQIDETAQSGTPVLPQSGDVRSEYANSGRWIERP